MRERAVGNKNSRPPDKSLSSGWVIRKPIALSVDNAIHLLNNWSQLYNSTRRYRLYFSLYHCSLLFQILTKGKNFWEVAYLYSNGGLELNWKLLFFNDSNGDSRVSFECQLFVLQIILSIVKKKTTTNVQACRTLLLSMRYHPAYVVRLLNEGA